MLRSSEARVDDIVYAMLVSIYSNRQLEYNSGQPSAAL